MKYLMITNGIKRKAKSTNRRTMLLISQKVYTQPLIKKPQFVKGRFKFVKGLLVSVYIELSKVFNEN